MTHPTWELPLNINNLEETAATLLLMPCPGTKDASLVESIDQIKEQGVTMVVTVLTVAELLANDVDNLPEVVQAVEGMKWFHLPVADDEVPGEIFHKQWEDTYPLIDKALNNGEKVAVHCLGGSGRTGLIAAHILLERNWPLDDIITEVKKLRPGAFSKPNQLDYIQEFAANK